MSILNKRKIKNYFSCLKFYKLKLEIKALKIEHNKIK